MKVDSSTSRQRPEVYLSLLVSFVEYWIEEFDSDQNKADDAATVDVLKSADDVEEFAHDQN